MITVPPEIISKIQDTKPVINTSAWRIFKIILLLSISIMFSSAAFDDYSKGNYMGGIHDPSIRPGGIKALEKETGRSLTIKKNDKTRILSLLDNTPLSTKSGIFGAFIMVGLLPFIWALWLLKKEHYLKAEYTKQLQAWKQISLIRLASVNEGLLSPEITAMAFNTTVNAAQAMLTAMSENEFAQVLADEEGGLVYKIKVPQKVTASPDNYSDN
jgi:hypothetical protein